MHIYTDNTHRHIHWQTQMVTWAHRFTDLISCERQRITATKTQTYRYAGI